jgi:hypothetical protein
MNMNIGSHSFMDVNVPILWGVRAIVQDRKGRLSVIDVSGPRAIVEVLGDKAAPGVRYELVNGGICVFQNGKALYSYFPDQKLISPVSLNLQEIQISGSTIRVGTNRFSNNSVSGFGVGISVDEHGIGLGAPLPAGLARLVV